MMAADGIEVLPEDRFDSYRLQVGNIRGLHGRILARADNNGRLTGDWKVVIGSSAKIRAMFKAPQLYTSPDLASFEFLLEAEAGAISFGTNRTVSDWTDVDVCVGQRLIAVLRGSSLNHDEAGFLAKLQTQESGSHFGAAIRWAVNTISSTAFSLDLQGLPMTAATAQGKPNLKTETAPVVKLCSFPVNF
jgi:hypothetical protein